jgi:3-dehydroquinate synthetase
MRAVLNLGHTVGHAIEAHGAFSRHLHGEAVAIGTVLELRAAATLGLSPVPLADRAKELLRRLGLPTEVPKSELAAAWPFVATDKKRVKASVRLPTVAQVGAAQIVPVPLADLKRALLEA